VARATLDGANIRRKGNLISYITAIAVRSHLVNILLKLMDSPQKRRWVTWFWLFNPIVIHGRLSWFQSSARRLTRQIELFSLIFMGQGSKTEEM